MTVVRIAAGVAALMLLMILRPLAAQTPETPVTGVTTLTGQTKALGNGFITSWMQLNADGTPAALGVSFPETALNGLPTTDTEVGLVFPFDVYKTPFTHFAINWNPHGHIPAGIYDVPHFDFHFYTLMPDEREMITATGDNLALVRKAPPADYVPSGYIAAPGGEQPNMGAHWANPASPEFHGQPFTQTFIYGFYNGNLAFLEPMVTRAYLLTHPVLAAPIPQPKAYPSHDYYPTQYIVQYDALNRVYSVALTGFIKR